MRLLSIALFAVASAAAPALPVRTTANIVPRHVDQQTLTEMLPQIYFPPSTLSLTDIPLQPSSSDSNRIGGPPGRAKLREIVKRVISYMRQSKAGAFQVTDSHISNHNNITHVYMTHLLNDLPIVNLVSHVSVDHNGIIVALAKPTINTGNLTKRAWIVSNIPVLTEIDAVLIAAKALGATDVDKDDLRSIEDDTGSRAFSVFA